MKINRISTFLVNSKSKKNWLLVKVESDNGFIGWGESYTQIDRDVCIKDLIKSMSRYIIGRDPHNIKHITQSMYRDFGAKRGSMELYSAISGIEIAIWDLIGHKYGIPIYNFLGGKCREKIRVYANYWYLNAKNPQDFARLAKITVKRGFNALKFDPFKGPWRRFIDKKEEDDAVEVIKEIRYAVGDDIDLLIEIHRRLAPMYAIRIAKKIEPYNVFWYEEPLSPENINALAKIKENISIPVVTGEALYTKFGFIDVLNKYSSDIINPDVCNCGGILELKEIAAMAEPYHVGIAPHNYNSVTIGLAATLQVCATIPNFVITEYFLPFEEVGHKIIRDPFTIDRGYIKLPNAPGLGIEIIEDEVAKYPYVQFPKRKFFLPKNEN